MPQNKPMPGEIYRHFKNKNYQIIAVATHSETREKYVVYQALYDDFATYIRPFDMFISPVDHIKYPQVTQEYRFEYVGLAGHEELPNAYKDATASDSEVSSSYKEEDFLKDEKSTNWGASCDEPNMTAQIDEPQTEDGFLEEGVNAKFLAFLDADTYNEKYDIVSEMEDDLDDHLINQMAASMDEIIEDGRLDQRIAQLESILRTKARYELHR